MFPVLDRMSKATRMPRELQREAGARLEGRAIRRMLRVADLNLSRTRAAKGPAIARDGGRRCAQP